jgi:tetratricopeptide (TPR) repeat protein
MNDRENIRRTAAEMQNAGRHEDAIELLEVELAKAPEDRAIQKQLALVYGGLAENKLRFQDQQGMPPSADQLEEMNRLLDRAIVLDPRLPDLQWDKAVIAARFLHQFEEADGFLQRAKELGYSHPMMGRLEEMIEQGNAVSVPPVNRLLELLYEFIQQARGPNARVLDADQGLPGIRTLKEYTEEATSLIEQGRATTDDYLAALTAADSLGGDVGEYALDLMRRVSPAVNEPEIERLATEAHLHILVQAASAYRGRVDQEGARALRRARRTAQRGLDVIESCGFEVDPDLHAELLLAYGGSYAHPADANLLECFRSYLDALQLKRKTKNEGDISRLQDLLAQMCQYQMQQTLVSGIIGGIGEQLEILKLAYQAAKETERRDLIVECGLALAETFGNVNQPGEAVPILEKLAEAKDLSKRQRFHVEFTLAARLSETRGQDAIKRARAIGERQVRELKKADYPVAAQTVWMNLGNFRRLDCDVGAAREAFQRAMKLCPEPSEREVPIQRGQIRMLLAETEILLGHYKKGRELLELADQDYKSASGVVKLHFESMAARLSFDLGDVEAAAEHADRGIDTRKFILERGPAPNVWESMLQEWTRLEVDAVRVRHRMGREADLREALLIAEAAKGRLFSWFVRAGRGQEAPKQALDMARHERALGIVQDWTKGARRWAVSLFAHSEGMSVMAIGPGGRVTGKWLDGFDYDDLRLRVFEPLERGLHSALETGDTLARGLSGAIVDMLLAKIGTWLWEALPDLRQGGEELVLLPHRLFRSLPLSHAVLPNGARLGEVFERVSLSPSLYELGETIDAVAKNTATATGVTAFMRGLLDSDAQRGLPFARLEGMVALGGENVKSGSQVTVQVLKEALGEPGTVLLSCHGDFNERNPWQSTVRGADGQLVLGQLLTEGGRIGSQLVVLGICEAGKSRRSLSDEPVSFPGFLVSMGARLVIAPMWQVDDFASFLFMRRLFQGIHAGIHPARAAADAAAWQRSLTARDAMRELDDIQQRLADGEWTLEDATRKVLELRITRYRHWLAADLQANDYAFDALDWAAFQVHGFLPLTK